MKYFSLLMALLLSGVAYAQPNRDEVALMDEKAFDMSFQFQYLTEAPITITFSREDNVDYLMLSGENNCRRNNMAYKTPIADLYVYEQFLNYLQELNITNYQPKQSSLDGDANLKMQCSISIPSTWSVNAFVFKHHPDNIGEERQILDFVINILKDNATDTCISELAETLSLYVSGE